jgi:hypothetical protein
MNDWHRGLADPGTLHLAFAGEIARVGSVAGPRWIRAVCGVRAAAEIVDGLRGAQCLWCRRWADTEQPGARDSSTTNDEMDV